jgi:hypothetical protein
MEIEVYAILDVEDTGRSGVKKYSFIYGKIVIAAIPELITHYKNLFSGVNKAFLLEDNLKREELLVKLCINNMAIANPLESYPWLRNFINPETQEAIDACSDETKLKLKK